MKIKLLGILLITLLFISGCSLDYIWKGEEQEPKEPIITCNKPYIQVGMDCCLDQNDNGICDEEENIQQDTQQTTPKPDLTIITQYLPQIQFTASTKTDLSDYPKPFVNNNKFDYIMIVGADGKPTDVIASTNIERGLAEGIGDTAPGLVIDTEFASIIGKNIILVGSPCHNQYTAYFLGLTYPACDHFKEDDSVIKLVDNGDKTALIVTGYSGDEIIRASRVLLDYNSYKTKLKGTEVKVIGFGKEVSSIV